MADNKTCYSGMSGNGERRAYSKKYLIGACLRYKQVFNRNVIKFTRFVCRIIVSWQLCIFFWSL